MLLNINKTTSILYFIKTIRVDVLRIAVFTLIISFISKGKYFQYLSIPLPLIAIIAIIGIMISLLLAFRTGQSYDRWWEARIVWGQL